MELRSFRLRKPSEPVRDIVIETSQGPIALSREEHALMTRIVIGSASAADGQAFYKALSDRNVAFAPEWEILVLRATLTEHPDRDDLIARLTFLEECKRAEQIRDVVVETSRGSVALSKEEHALMTRIVSGQANAAEGQALYKALLDRNVAFAPEWEIYVLRSTLAEHPDRDDLVTRLAILEESLGATSPSAQVSPRFEFERACFRFGRAELMSAEKEEEPLRRKSAVDDACAILSSAIFDALPVSRRVEVVVALHNTLLSSPGDDLPLIAELMVRRLRQMFEEADLTEAQACTVYDAAHALYFAGISDVRDLRRFDRISPVFEAWLETKLGRKPRPDLPLPPRPLSIAYFLHTAHFDRGNAVSPLIASLVQMHSASSDRRIYLYAVQHVGEAFEERFANSAVIVRNFAQDGRYDRIDEIAAALKADGVDVVITEQNRALAAALFVRRVAARQLWLDTGFPFWSLEACDWTLSPVLSADQGNLRTSPIKWRQSIETLKGSSEPKAVARIRESFPRGAFVLGVFVRLVKLDAAFLDFLSNLLKADPRFHIVIAGPGDSGAVDAFAARLGSVGRVTIVPGMVDLNLYGPAIDAMCDTFPFVGGNACREVMVHGTPVIAKLGTPWDSLLRADRCPPLLADSEADFISIACRLANDEAFRQEQRKAALHKAQEFSDPTIMVENVEAAISAAFGANLDHQ